MYAEFATDPKVQLLAFDDQRHFAMLLCLKCNDTLDSKVSPEFLDRMVSKALGLDPVSATEAKRRLVEVGLIDGRWQPVKWDTRQYEHDLSTSRVRKFRERNAGETLPKRNETVSETTENRTEQIQTRVRAEPEKDSRRAASGEPESLDKALFAEAREVFGRSIGGTINRAIRERGKPFVVEMIELCRTKDPEAARAYLMGAMKKPGANPYANAL